ncbi:BglII/BstYI family type II restriction endonuclease [Anaerocolumna sp. MB42-C2]|uniref:BglII/BstYI family type II restriction endonuclease n=1 Tax=Anaerocolumna sp. MB42-C2 TaxID=3070997 RepID=UPI0027DFEC08|nr:BglII/BstYI family type II restriction endonuclease [Anaerocolumna sp. MB42-C2]WMJ86975.1 BglII/BstYI family type II restriction endonuclease [Anaerocolumna sp. MB42-C2]
MIVKTYSYRYAEEILQNPKYLDAYKEIIDICKKCPVPVFKGKSSKQAKKDVIQQVMNTYFKVAFLQRGWEDEPLATPEDNEDVLRSDFRKKFERRNEDSGPIILQIEVEFGNIASAYRNYFKFQLSYSYGLTDVCILILPSQHLSTRIDSGVANFEKALREIPAAKLSITVPILIVGLYDMDDIGHMVDEWNIKNQGIEIAIAKNVRKEYNARHLAMIQEYINRIANE